LVDVIEHGLADGSQDFDTAVDRLVEELAGAAGSP
jgi:hypothetical protein